MTLSLAIAANSAVFSTVHAVLLEPSAIRQPHDLVICWERTPAGSAVVELSYRNYQDWIAHSRSFSHAAAVGSSPWPVILDTENDAVRLSSAGVSASFFDTLGVSPSLGRSFRPADDLPNAARVAILSHRTWTSRFAGAPGIVGATIRLGVPHTVIGVMPRDFDFPRGTDVWLPVVPILANAGNGRLRSPLESVGVLFVIGRLRADRTAAMAREELDGVATELARHGGPPRFGAAVVVTPFLDYLVGPVRGALWSLFAAVIILLLIACANVSGLIRTRITLQRRERAIRLALGATAARLGRQTVMEALVLALAGGALGLIASGWVAAALVSLAPQDVPRLSEVRVNLPVAAFTFVAVLAAALLCSAQPVRNAGSFHLMDALHEAAGATLTRRALGRRSLVIAFQITLTVVLLVGAGLVFRSFVRVRSIDVGFVSSNVVTMNVTPRKPKPSANEWTQDLLRRVAALPEVEAAGAVSLRPLALGPIGSETWVILEGQPDTPASARRNPMLNYQVATPGYFSAMGIRTIEGRLFDARDTARSPRVALVGERTARVLWPGENPVGRRLLMPAHTPAGGPAVWRTVVGVVSDVRYRGLGDLRLDVYDAALQAASSALDIVIRTSAEPSTIAAAVKLEARRLDAGVLIDGVTTMDEVVSAALAPWRFSTWMFGLFAGLAFLLAAVGLFSQVGLDVADRRREFAVRLALGAAPATIGRSVLASVFRRVVPAVALGVVSAAVATRAIRHLLFGVESLDLATYAVVILLVLTVVAAACWLPARRAARIDPLELLRRV